VSLNNGGKALVAVAEIHRGDSGAGVHEKLIVVDLLKTDRKEER